MGLMTWLARCGQVLLGLMGAAPTRLQSADQAQGGDVVEPLVATPPVGPVPTLAPPPEPRTTTLLNEEAVAKFFAGFGTDNKPWRPEQWSGGRIAGADPAGELASRSIAEAFDRAVWDPVTPMTATLTAADEAAAAQATVRAEAQRAQLGTTSVAGFFRPAGWQG